MKSVLIIDDMPQTLTLLRRVLESRGHVVYAAENAAAAYSIVRSHGDEIGLVLMDMSVGRTWGDELARVLKERIPDSRYIFMSGTDAGDLDRQRLLDRGAIVLRKPFRLSQVSEAIRAALADHLPLEAARLEVSRPQRNS